MSDNINKNDLLDNLINDWKRERPNLDASAMHIVGRIMQLGKKLEKQASNALSSSNIYYTDLDVLATLRRSGIPYQLSPTQLRKSVLITSGAMTALLNRLEKIDLIYRLPDPKDGRVSTAALTKKGVKVINSAIVSRFEVAESAIRVFKKEERKQFARLLKKMLISIEFD
jgi:DNA-binding MarR family transcriptional regulator